MSRSHKHEPSASPWARSQVRHLGAVVRAADAFANRYTVEGAIDYTGPIDESRDGGDDFLEPFAQWPLIDIAAGSPLLGRRALHHYEAISLQLDALGYTKGGLDLGTDWFHQGEGNELLYNLLQAGYGAAVKPQVTRYAQTQFSAEGKNYDHQTRMFRSPHPGVEGPRFGIKNGDHAMEWAEGMRHYGLPIRTTHASTYDDLRKPGVAEAVGAEVRDRLGRGDAVMNLSSCGLALSAWMLTGNDKFRTWMIDYTSAWIERADSNGGLVPDNVGPDGVVGQLHGGQWFGGLYGWAWPHGAFSVLQAVAVASLSCHTATGDDRFLDFIRGQLDRLMELGQVDRLASASGALREEHLSRFRPEELDAHALLIPHRHNEDGWHDFLPMELAIPTAVWLASGKSADWSRIEHLRSVSTYDWTAMRPTRQKEDSGHEEPWLAFLSGTNPQFPEKSISMADEILAHRLDVMSKDATPSDYPDIHHWQNLNPVSAEVLLQNRVGGCSPLYYGGLLSNAVRFRVIAGSAAQLASSVSSIGHDQVELTLECLEGAQGISVHLEAGAFGQHRVDAVAVGGIPLSPHELQSLTVAPGTTRMIVLSLTRNAIAPTFPTIATELSGPPR